MAIYTRFAARVLSLFRTDVQMRSLNRIFGSLFVLAAAAPAMFMRN
jgi:homoserine/homoserine lactone efflux protein